VRQVTTKTTDELTPTEATNLRGLLDDAFEGRYTDAFWNQALGGSHFFVVEDGVPLSHASVVWRTLIAGKRSVDTGYVESVGTRNGYRHRGLAGLIMASAQSHIAERYEMGALHSVLPTFYEHLGWEKWRGPTYVRIDGASTRTPEDDECIHVWRGAESGELDLDDPISCDWRPGFVW
jgi:aminoglycoside 2'-N-acetyltransferase I